MHGKYLTGHLAYVNHSVVFAMMMRIIKSITIFLQVPFWWSYAQLSLSLLTGWFPNLCYLPRHHPWLILFSIFITDHYLNIPPRHPSQYIQVKLSFNSPISDNGTGILPGLWFGNLGDIFAVPLWLPTSPSRIVELSACIMWLHGQW